MENVDVGRFSGFLGVIAAVCCWLDRPYPDDGEAATVGLCETGEEYSFRSEVGDRGGVADTVADCGGMAGVDCGD